MSFIIIVLAIFLGISLACWPVITLLVIGCLISAFLIMGVWVEINDRR